MVKGIRMLKQDEPTPENLRKEEKFRQFLIAFAYALTFAPDRESSQSIRELEEEYEHLFGRGALIRDDLEDAFFSQLYVDRVDRVDLIQLLPALRPVLVYGLVGSGKTVILKRVLRDFADPAHLTLAYFDLKASSGLDEALPGTEFREAFRDLVHSSLFTESVLRNEDALRKWNRFSLFNDPGSSRFLEYATSRGITSLQLEEDWEQLIKDPEISAAYSRWYRRPQLGTLISFLRGRGLYAVLLDNVDRYPLQHQQHILTEAIHLSNEVQICFVVAIRDTNLKRITLEGENGDFVFYDEIRRLEMRVPKKNGLNLGSLENTDQRILLSKRIGFVERYVGKYAIDSVLAELKEDKQYNLREFKAKFWKLFNTLAHTFVDAGVYEICNHNIRTVLTVHFNFIARIILYPDPSYDIPTLLGHNEEARTTALRTYFYRWLICSPSTSAPARLKLANVLQQEEGSKLAFTKLRVLCYLFNRKKVHHEPRVAFADLVRAFKPLGVSRDILQNVLFSLSKEQSYAEMGFIWCNAMDAESIADDQLIEILPAGAFFADRLSTSREYAFWAALCAELPSHVVDKSFPVNRTYDSAFKLEVVYRLLKDILLPELTDLGDAFVDASSASDHTDRPAHYIRDTFAVSGGLYSCYLLVVMYQEEPTAVRNQAWGVSTLALPSSQRYQPR